MMILVFAIFLLLVFVVSKFWATRETFTIKLSNEQNELIKLIPVLYDKFKTSGTKGVTEMLKRGMNKNEQRT